jgi:hypothetical protein
MFGTQIIGDVSEHLPLILLCSLFTLQANNWPLITAAASFVGLGVFSTDVYVDNGGTGSDGSSKEWYINTV